MEIPNFTLLYNYEDFVLYEFETLGVEYFVRFYKKDNLLWRRGYWYKEKEYFQNNINKIESRLPTEKNPKTISRLKKELFYFKSNVHFYDKFDIIGKGTNPITISNYLSVITINFLNLKESSCDVLEIQHLRKSDENVSTRLKLTQRSLLKYVDFNKWYYKSEQSTSILYKHNVDLIHYNIEIY